VAIRQETQLLIRQLIGCSGHALRGYRRA
jgi:hypothetical protein